ncbi:aminotransferase class V-fold PLP-dependent enzyme [Edaphobacter bradus]|uniref:aminotransferase class V-fold PLP-dependent enzyme n=1 Tax=Edaphobacter bradus TaxID=2259016 RepID=UPI0021DFF0BA|nr:aminotransferase class V-fold PLP-dependent enzyme [Edaphobacter bradus]
MNAQVRQALSAIGGGPLREEPIQQYVAPLFSRVLSGKSSYLANHSLGRPLNVMTDDIAEAIALWYGKLGDAWDGWLEEREAFRARVATLIGATRADCVVPKTSAGQGLRAVLNALPGRPRVISTRGEFDSIDVILKQYAALGRIALQWVEPDAQGDFAVGSLIEAVDDGADLVVVSQVMFMTGQIVAGLDRLAKACHERGAKLLVDSYHAVGVIPVDVVQMSADFVIGGSYKYLRGGPGACFLYIEPEVLESGLRPLDMGWFANSDTFGYDRPELPALQPGGGAFLESTPPVLTWYQARSGAEFTLAMGVERLREYSLQQLNALRGYLAAAGISAVTGGDEGHGGFLAIRLANAMEFPARLEREGIVCDARGEWLRLCPDCLTRDEELRFAADVLGRLISRG